MNSLEEKEIEAKEFLSEMIDKHTPIHTTVGFSGGHDSLVCTHLVMSHLPDASVFHCNTGIGVEKTREFVRDTCKEQGWPLREILPEEHKGCSYEEWVERYGFPQGGAHSYMYINLKERAIEQYLREIKEGHHLRSRILLCFGVRKDESVRRMGKIKREWRRRAPVYLSPIIDFTSADKEEYIKKYELPRNPVVDTLGMSGECLCGAFSHKGEKDLVKLVCKDTYDKISAMEQKVKELGHKSCVWENHRPSKKNKRAGIMCVGCEK